MLPEISFSSVENCSEFLPVGDAVSRLQIPLLPLEVLEEEKPVNVLFWFAMEPHRATMRYGLEEEIGICNFFPSEKH